MQLQLFEKITEAAKQYKFLIGLTNLDEANIHFPLEEMG